MGNEADLPVFAPWAKADDVNETTTAQNVRMKARRMRNLRDPCSGRDLQSEGNSGVTGGRGDGREVDLGTVVQASGVRRRASGFGAFGSRLPLFGPSGQARVRFWDFS